MSKDRDGLTIFIPRRWLQFSLRTLFLLMVLAALVSAGLARWQNAPVGLEGFCPVTLLEEARWAKGDEQFSTVYDGRRYHFAGPEQLKTFELSPEKFRVAVAGSDVVLLMDEDREVPGHRSHGLEYYHWIFLFESEESLQKFARNPKKYAAFAVQWSRRRAEARQ